MKLVLASGSPRRRQMLEKLGLEIEVFRPPDELEESVDLDGIACSEVAEVLARAKCRAVTRPDAVVLAADTVVILDGEILGKPLDVEDCRRQLRALSGRTHLVITGYCLAEGGRFHADSVQTQVKFRELDQSEIEAYIATEEPFDKAGGYGIQGWGGLLVESVNGCYFNVVGLPLSAVAARLHQLGYSVWANAPC